MTEPDSSSSLPFGMYSVEEERANFWTHAVGAALGGIAGYILLTSIKDGLLTSKSIACVVYIATLMLVYVMSTLSHARLDANVRGIFRSLDQGCIYLFIVGTYTPFSVTYLQSAYWWWLLAVMWGLALAGFVSKVFFTHRVESVSIWLYLALGWIPILSSSWILTLVPYAAFAGIVLGGVCYSLGTLFLILDHRIRYFHACWHLMVIAGSTIHYVCILRFVP